MKVIELLNKIANGEEVPKKIKYCYEYEYKEDELGFIDYINIITGTHLFGEDYVMDDINLNQEVEIIEEEKKPITKEDIEALGYAFGEIKKCFVKGWDKSLNNEKLEEDKKIEKLRLVSHCSGTFAEEQAFRNRRDDEITTKINEIIDIVNKLKVDRK